jgi:peptidoglycan/LPS O-acetylase OafA/YrhL
VGSSVSATSLTPIDTPSLVGAQLPTQPLREQRFIFLDSLRGLAALWVLLFHYFEAGHAKDLERVLPGWLALFFRSGHFGVPIFFVLSGFVIAHSVGNQRVDSRFIGRFMFRRSIRLDPMYWFSIAAVIGVGFLNPLSHPPLPSLPRLAAHLFYAQGLLGFKQINNVCWTLCLEVQFYLVFCLMLLVIQRFRRSGQDHRSLVGMAVLSGGIAVLWPLGFAHFSVWPGLFLPQWYSFLAGVFAYWTFQKRLPGYWFYLFAGSLLISPTAYRHFPGLAAMIGLLILFAGRLGKLGGWLTWRPLQVLGAISYSLYLLHNPATGMVGGLAYTTPRTAAWELFWLVAIAALVCFIAYLAWRFIERPSILLSKRFKLQSLPETSPRESIHRGPAEPLLQAAPEPAVL